MTKRIAWLVWVLCIWAPEINTGMASPAGDIPEILLVPKTSLYSPEKGSECFYGTVKGIAIVFEHQDYTKFRMTENGKLVEGALNTERGFGDDPDATVYVLNFGQPEEEWRYIVRYSSGRVVMLDQDRKEIPQSNLRKKQD